MSTRCCIEIYDGDYNHKEHGKPVTLYHHSDGYPSFQLPKLATFLLETHKRLDKLGYPYWWDTCRVSAMLVLLSAKGYEKPECLGESDFKAATQRNSRAALRSRKLSVSQICMLPYGYPQYQPTSGLHGDIEYIYRVSLFTGSEAPGDYMFRIACYATGNGNKFLGEFTHSVKSKCKLNYADLKKLGDKMRTKNE